MDLALTINAWIDEEVMFAQQLGARHIFASMDPLWAATPGWDAQSLTRLANRVEKAGLVLAGLYATPPVKEPLAWTAQLLRDAAKAKIELLSLSATLIPAPSSTQEAFPESPASHGRCSSPGWRPAGDSGCVPPESASWCSRSAQSSSLSHAVGGPTFRGWAGCRPNHPARRVYIANWRKPACIG